LDWPPAQERCGECGFDWSISPSEAILLAVEDIGRYPDPGRIRSSERPVPPGTWTPTQYLWHVVDVLRFGTERLWTLVFRPGSEVPSWDENVLAAVRSYGALSPEAGARVLEDSVPPWRKAAEAAPAEATVDHPEYGRLSAADMIRRNSHDVHHHLMDIERLLPPDGSR
jgi:DinB superfamily